MKNAFLKIRLILWLIIVVTTAWFLYLGIVPSGHIKYRYGFENFNRFISKLGPNDRVAEPINDTQKIIGNPVYFSLFTPRSFDSAKLILKYRTNDSLNNNGLALIEAGVLADKTVWRYNLQPVENKVIDRLSLVWDSVRDGEKILLQKKKKYNSLSEFLTNPPGLEKIAVYNYNPGFDYVIKDYQARDAKEVETILPISLRGSWQLYTYIKDEKLDFSFDFKDLNQNRDSDDISLLLFFNNSLIDSKKMSDDGLRTDIGQKSGLRSLSLQVPGLPEGVYKIELKVNDDIVTEKIRTKQERLSFVNKINFYEINKKGVELFSDSKKIQAVTALQEGLQTVSIGSGRLDVNSTFKQFEGEVKKASTTARFAEIKLEKGKISLSGRGVFAFDQQALINPELKKVDGDLDVLGEGVEYVLASYRSPYDADGWKKAEIEFDLSSAFSEDGKYSFIISLPGLKLGDGINDSVEIGGVEVELAGESLMGLIKSRFGRLFGRLFR